MVGRGELDKRLIVAGAIAAVGLAMLIAGSVMLGVGVHKSKQKSSCPTCPQCQQCSYQPSAVFTSSYTPSIQYSADLANPNSPLFKSTSDSLSQNITSLLNSPPPQKASVFATAPGTVVTINSYLPSSNGVGVNFYASIIFPHDGMSAAAVQTQMNTMYSTNANASPTTQCSTLAIPPGEPASNITTTTIATTTPKVLPSGVFCDATGQNLLQVFLVDVAVPFSGTLDDKLATIRQFLGSYDGFINLHNNGSWGTVGFQYVAYTDQMAAPSRVCYDDACWHTQVDALISAMVNPSGDSSHTLSSGLHGVVNSVMPNPGQARNLLILSDGIDITDTNYTIWANILKAQNYQIGAYVVSTNQETEDVFDSVVSSVTYRYYVSDWYWIQEPTVDATISQWSCATTYPTPAPTTAAPTPPTIRTTTTPKPTTTSVLTTPSGPLPVPNCVVDVLFLVDESLSMIKNGYDQSLAYVQNIAQQIYATNNASSFAIITFNSVIVYQSPSYVTYDGLVKQIAAIPVAEGSTDFIIGFSTARDLISNKSRYSVDGVRSVLIFLSDGWSDSSTSITTVQGISHQMRSLYSTEIIAMGLVEDPLAQSLTKEAIDYGANDAYVQSQYIDVPMLGVLTSLVNVTLSAISCKTMTPQSCATDLIFVIEVSEAELDSNIEVERNTVNRLIDHYSGIIGPNAGEVSLIFFSSPDGLTAAENNRSGILYQMIDDSNLATSILNAKDFHPLGGASDVNLAMNLVLKVFASDIDDNDQFVLFFGRGAYKDAPNCCNDPTNSSAAVRSQATVQGIVIGSYPDKNLMDTFTGSNSIDGNALLVMDATNHTDVAASAQALQNVLIPLIDRHLASVYCHPMPVLSSPCSQYDDIVLILHANSADNWSIVKQFVTQLVIPALTGPISNVRQGRGLYVNLAVTYYFGQTVSSINWYAEQYSTQQIVDALNDVAFITTNETNSLSQAYKEASLQLGDGRLQASKTVLVLTDVVDTADYESVQVQRSKMIYSYVYGMFLNAQPGDFVPGQDGGIVVTDIQQINPNNTRSAIVLANVAAAGVCRNVPITTLPPVTTPTPKPTPAPIPRVKSRDVWPDIALLIDASSQNQSFFEQQRQFLRNTFLNQYRLGYSWSRMAVAVYSNTTTLLCSFADITSYWDLESCLGSQLDYSTVVNNAIPTRDISQALIVLSQRLYYTPNMGDTGYKPLKTNYLYVLTNGASSTEFYVSATMLKGQGVRVVGIDISTNSEMTPEMLSDFGPDSYSVNKFTDPVVSDQLSQSIVQQTTTEPRPALSSLFSDFYFIVDNSFSQAADLPNVQSFVLKFFDQLTVSPHRSRVSIVPYSDSVMNPLPTTDDYSTVVNYINAWKFTAPGSNSSNIGLAITYVQNMVNQQRVSHVIYLVGAANATGVDVAAKLMNTPGVNSYSLNYNAVQYAGFLTNNPATVFKIDDSAHLMNWVESQFPVNVRGRNPMNQFFNTLLDVQQTADLANFPQKEVAADIMIFLDETGLSEDDFANIKQFLFDFTNQFTIGQFDTQFALQAFSAQIIPQAGWHFYDSSNNNAVTQRISNLSLVNSSSTASADLAGAVDQALFYFLQPAYGWRESAVTYSIIITNANSFVFGSNSSLVITALQAKSSVYALSLNNATNDYVRNWVNTGFYETVPTPQALTTTSGAGSDLSNQINLDYKARVYPPMPALDTIKADFVFLIDNTNASDIINIYMIRNFLLKFISRVGDQNSARFSVINYNSMGVVQNQSWTLRATPANDRTALIKAIRSINITNDTNPPDLVSAVAFFSAVPELFGVDTTKPVFVIGLFTSPTVQAPLSTAVTNDVNLNYFTFAVQYNGNTMPFDYLPSFLGKDYAEDFAYTNDLTTYDITPMNDFANLNTYIQSESSAFSNTYSL